MTTINSFLKALSTGDNVRDYRHASRVFVDGNHRLAPKRKFLFHVVFQVNSNIGHVFKGSEKLEASFLVKSVDLPKFRFDISEHNQYNRKRFNYTSMQYDPASIVFHDDGSDVIRNMWYAYYAYYNNDPQYEKGVYTYRDIYKPYMDGATQWGLDRNTEPFFDSIKIYSLYQKKYTEYWFVNPIIESFDHDLHDYSDTGTMEHRMSIRFETVKYMEGYVDNNDPPGFGSTHYDTLPSPLTPPGGGTTSIIGPGGVADVAGSIGADLASGNIAGAVVTGLRGAENFKGANLQQVAKEELTGNALAALRGQGSLVGDFNFPNRKAGRGNPLPIVPKGTYVTHSLSERQNNVRSGNDNTKLKSVDFALVGSDRIQSGTTNFGSASQSHYGPRNNRLQTHTDVELFRTGTNDFVSAQRTLSDNLPNDNNPGTNASASVGNDLTTNPYANKRAQDDAFDDADSGIITKWNR